MRVRGWKVKESAALALVRGTGDQHVELPDLASPAHAGADKVSPSADHRSLRLHVETPVKVESTAILVEMGADQAPIAQQEIDTVLPRKIRTSQKCDRDTTRSISLFPSKGHAWTRIDRHAQD